MKAAMISLNNDNSKYRIWLKKGIGPMTEDHLIVNGDNNTCVKVETCSDYFVASKIDGSMIYYLPYDIIDYITHLRKE